MNLKNQSATRKISLVCWLLALTATRAQSSQFSNAIVHAQQSYTSVEKIQQQNMAVLEKCITQGWKAFCDAKVDEGIMSLFSGVNPSDATLHVMTANNQSIELPIKLISELRDFDINPERHTIIYVNGYYTPDGYFSVMSHLKLLQTKRRDLNVIIVNFARDLKQLYYSVRHHLTIQGYFVAKILAVLISNGIDPKSITLAGHSVGANIAALGATLYSDQTKTPNLPDGIKIGQLLAIDPARMCRPDDVYVGRNVSEQVVVLHGESEFFGLRDALGTIDIYPNGIGAMMRKKEQPGCETPLCSHMYPFILFMEALIEGVTIPAVQCESWSRFRKMECNYNDVIVIGLKYSKKAAGTYFCATQANPPFTFEENSIKYRKSP